MALARQDFWVRKQAKEFVDEAKHKAHRYFRACEQYGLLNRWRRQYELYYMRDPYGKSVFFNDSSMLSLGTKQRPEIAIQVPEVRSLIRQQLAFLFAEQHGFQCVSSTGAQRNVMSSEVGEKAINYVFDEHIRPQLRPFAEEAIVYGLSATHLRWNSEAGDSVKMSVPAQQPAQIVDPVTQQMVPNPQAGQPMMQPEQIPDPQTGQMVPNPQAGQPMMHSVMGKSGAPYVDVCNPTMFAMDPIIGTKAGWIIGFERTNLYVLAGQVMNTDPALADLILQQSVNDEFEQYRLSPHAWSELYGADEGDTVVMHVYYADRPEYPGGRYALCVGDIIITKPDEPCPLPAGRLPIRPIITAQITDNALSWADSFGLGPLEEALNRTRSAELNNFAYFGKQVRWRENSTQTVLGEDLQTREMVGPRGSAKPEMLAIQPMPNTDPLKKDLIDSLPRISGYADVSRGLNVKDTTSGAHVQSFEAITARNLSLPDGDFKKHEQELANDMLTMLQNFGNTAFIAEIAGEDGQALAKEFSPQDLSTLRRLVIKVVPEAMRGPLARIQLLEITKDIEDPRERAKAVQMVLRGDDEYGKNDQRGINLIAIENERLVSGSAPVKAVITQNHVAHMIDHQASLDYLVSQDNPDPAAIDRHTQHLMEHNEMLQNADPVFCKALGYPDPPILPGNAAFVFAQRMQEARMMLAPPPPPDAGNSNEQTKETSQGSSQSGPPQASPQPVNAGAQPS